MKSITRLLSVVALVGALGFANVSKADWLGGIKGGIQINTLTGGTTSETKPLFGVWFDGVLAPMFHIQPELNLNLFSTNWTYLDVPVLLKVKFDAAPGFKPYIAAGFQAGFALANVAGAVNTLNFSIPFGAGFEFDVSPGVVLGLDGRYVLGLSDTSVTTLTSVQARSFQITALVGFAL